MQRRTPRGLAATIGLALLTAAACDDSNQGDGASAGSAGQQAAGAAGQPAGGASGQGQSGTSGQAGGPLDDPANYSGPLVAVDTSTLDPSYPNQTCKRQLRLARAGGEVAALYSDAGKVWLQRLDLEGKALGDPTALGDAETDTQGDVLPPDVSLATDGAGYVACWDTDVTSISQAKAKVSCVRVPVGGGAVTPLFTETACRPSVAWRSEGFVVASQRPGHVTVRYLDPASTVAPFEVPAPNTEGSSYSPPDVLLAPTASGFAMVTMADLTLHRLDTALTAIGEPQELDTYNLFVATPHLLAIGDTVVLGKARPYEFRLTIAAPGQPVAQVSYAGGVKVGMNAALTSDASSVGVFAPVTTLDGPALIFHAVDPAHPPTQSIEARLDFSYLGNRSWGDECSFAAVPVDGATLVAVPALHGVEVVRFPQP